MWLYFIYIDTHIQIHTYIYTHISKPDPSYTIITAHLGIPHRGRCVPHPHCVREDRPGSAAVTNSPQLSGASVNTGVFLAIAVCLSGAIRGPCSSVSKGISLALQTFPSIGITLHNRCRRCTTLRCLLGILYLNFESYRFRAVSYPSIFWGPVVQQLFY